jgi:hypothetical protein
VVPKEHKKTSAGRRLGSLKTTTRRDGQADETVNRYVLHLKQKATEIGRPLAIQARNAPLYVLPQTKNNNFQDFQIQRYIGIFMSQRYVQR